MKQNTKQDIDDFGYGAASPNPYSMASLLEGLETSVVAPEVIAILSEHILDREAGVFGRKENSLSGFLGLKEATIKRGKCELAVPLLDLGRGSMTVLVGPNGSGKSTFFDTLMEVNNVDLDLKGGWGTLAIGSSKNLSRKSRKQTRIARLDQEEILGPIEDKTAYDTIQQGLKFFLDQFPIDDDAWGTASGYDSNIANQEAQQRITEITSALFNLFKMDQCAGVTVKNLSGGERTKLSLILVMMSDADIALFDEPTNHLDLVTIANLLGIFERYKRDGVCIVNISHVGWFLKMAGTNKTLQINQGVLDCYKSPYAKVGRHIDFSPTNIERIDWCQDGRLKSGELLEGFEKRTILNSPLINVSFASLLPNEIRLLIGDNGTGKTTLMEYFAKNADTRHGNVAYLPQFWPDSFMELDPTVEDFLHYVIDQTLVACDGASRNVAKNIFLSKLQSTSLSGKQRRFLDLSGGEQRLAWFLAVSSIPAIDVLMSDEPTNHMDDRMRGVVTRAMIDFSHTRGGVMISTHDLELMRDFDAVTSLSLHANIFTKQDKRTVISHFDGESISAFMQERIAQAKVQGRRAI